VGVRENKHALRKKFRNLHAKSQKPSSYSFLSVHPDRQRDGQTVMARSTQLVIPIKNIYTLWGQKRFLLPFTYFPTNLEHTFTLRVTCITIRNRYLRLIFSVPKNRLIGYFFNKILLIRVI